MRPAQLYRSEAFAEDLEPAGPPLRWPVAGHDAERAGVRAWAAAVTQAWQRVGTLRARPGRDAAARPTRGPAWSPEAGAAAASAGADR